MVERKGKSQAPTGKKSIIISDRVPRKVLKKAKKDDSKQAVLKYHLIGHQISIQTECFKYFLFNHWIR